MTNTKQNTLYFIIGTEAELMKLFPVIQAAKNKGLICRLITSGQNNIRNSSFLKLIHEKIFFDISSNLPNEKTALSYLKWFICTIVNGKRKLNGFFEEKSRRHNLIVIHGDTLTTVIGAWIAQKCKMPYVHIESGLRSYNFLSPFPEEFDRLLGSLHSVINFCPKPEYAEYAAIRFRGKSVNTAYNTGIETLLWALRENAGRSHLEQPQKEYFLFMLHRQENLKSKDFLRETTKAIVELTKKIHCVFIFHDQTAIYMKKAGVFDILANNRNVTMLRRQEYKDFIKLVNSSEFVISDGCGNQQEFYYLGKPNLIMRTSIERDSEGIGWNAKPFNGDFSSIIRFYEEYHSFKKEPTIPTVMPSEIIINEIVNYFSNLT